MYDSTEIRAVDLEMSHREASALLEFVEHLLNEWDGDSDARMLDIASEKLDDAAAAATWLRENVRVEWSAAEALELLDALTIRSDDETAPQRERPFLPNVRTRLEACLKPGQRV